MSRKQYLNKDFTEIPSLDVILEVVHEHLPEQLKYIKMCSRTCGWQQYEMHINFFDNKWKEISDLLFDEFSETQMERFDGEYCVSDFIHNSLIGMTELGLGLEYFEFFPDRDYFYEYKK